MHACLQMKTYADVISEGLNCKKQSLCFTLKWFPICFRFLFFVMSVREIKKKKKNKQNKEKKKRKERKLEAEGRIDYQKRSTLHFPRHGKTSTMLLFLLIKADSLILRKVKNAGLEYNRMNITWYARD